MFCCMEMVPLPEVEETLDVWKKKKQKKKPGEELETKGEEKED